MLGKSRHSHTSLLVLSPKITNARICSTQNMLLPFNEIVSSLGILLESVEELVNGQFIKCLPVTKLVYLLYLLFLYKGCYKTLVHGMNA